MSLRIVGLVISALAVAGGCLAIFFSTRNAALAAYNAAPACASLAEAEAGRNCRITRTATVTQITPDGDASDIYFAFPGPYVPSSSARLPAGVVMRNIAIGAKVPVEVWGYRITKIAGVATADNPANDPRPVNLRTTGFLLAVLGSAAAIALMLFRRLPTSSSSLAPIAVSDALWR